MSSSQMRKVIKYFGTFEYPYKSWSPKLRSPVNNLARPVQSSYGQTLDATWLRNFYY